MLAIVDDVLDMSKIESGKIEFECVPFSIQALIQQQIRVFRSRAVVKPLLINCEIGDGVPLHVWGDPTRLNQILSNLLSNALKFTERGSINLIVRRTDTLSPSPLPRAAGTRADTMRESVKLVMKVVDTGMGIAAEDLSKLFQPFAQAGVSITRTHGGSGLGLSIVTHMVSLMGGSLDVESVLHKGTSFILTLTMPVARGDDLKRLISPLSFNRLVGSGAAPLASVAIGRHLSSTSSADLHSSHHAHRDHHHHHHHGHNHSDNIHQSSYPSGSLTPPTPWSGGLMAANVNGSGGGSQHSRTNPLPHRTLPILANAMGRLASVLERHTPRHANNGSYLEPFDDNTCNGFDDFQTVATLSTTAPSVTSPLHQHRSASTPSSPRSSASLSSLSSSSSSISPPSPSSIGMSIATDSPEILPISASGRRLMMSMLSPSVMPRLTSTSIVRHQSPHATVTTTYSLSPFAGSFTSSAPVDLHHDHTTAPLTANGHATSTVVSPQQSSFKSVSSIGVPNNSVTASSPTSSLLPQSPSSIGESRGTGSTTPSLMARGARLKRLALENSGLTEANSSSSSSSTTLSLVSTSSGSSMPPPPSPTSVVAGGRFTSPAQSPAVQTVHRSGSSGGGEKRRRSQSPPPPAASSSSSSSSTSPTSATTISHDHKSAMALPSPRARLVKRPRLKATSSTSTQMPLMQQQQQQQQQQRLPSGHVIERPRLLLVEDELVNQKLLQRMIAEHADLDIAANGAEALTLVQTRSNAITNSAIPTSSNGGPHGKANGNSKGNDEKVWPYPMILMDLNMAVMDGYEATRQLRQLGYTMPIIAVSANALLEERTKAEQAGISGFL
jgi:CheY-like chemotaxis protein